MNRLAGVSAAALLLATSLAWVAPVRADWRTLCAAPADREAFAACEAAVEAADETEAGRRLAGLLLSRGDEAGSVERLAELARRWPDDAGIQFDYAAALATLRNYDAAAAPITAALRLGARDVASYRLAAIIYERLPRPEEAFVFHLRLARLGDRIGMVDLAWDYSVGRGVEPDLEQALAWYQKAADLGHVGAMLTLAEAHRAGDLGLSPDPAQAAAWDDRAAAARGEAGSAD